MEIGLWPSSEPLDSEAAAWDYHVFAAGAVDCLPDPRTERFIAGLPGIYAKVVIHEVVRPKPTTPLMPVPMRAWVQGRYFVLLEIEYEAIDCLEPVRDLAAQFGLVGY